MTLGRCPLSNFCLRGTPTPSLSPASNSFGFRVSRGRSHTGVPLLFSWFRASPTKSNPSKLKSNLYKINPYQIPEQPLQNQETSDPNSSSSSPTRPPSDQNQSMVHPCIVYIYACMNVSMVCGPRTVGEVHGRDARVCRGSHARVRTVRST